MALRQGKYSALGKALGQYRTSLYDVMEKEHDKEFLSWKGERDRANLAGGIAAAAQGIDMLQKMRSKKHRAQETIDYLKSDEGGGATSIERKTKHGGVLGKMQMGIEDLFGGEATYDVEGVMGGIKSGEYGAGELRGQAQYHAVESMMNPEQADKETAQRKSNRAMYEKGIADNPFLEEDPWKETDDWAALEKGETNIKKGETNISKEYAKRSVYGYAQHTDPETFDIGAEDFGIDQDIYGMSFKPDRTGDKGWDEFIKIGFLHDPVVSKDKKKSQSMLDPFSTWQAPR